jgi:hypothetical protein
MNDGRMLIFVNDDCSDVDDDAVVAAGEEVEEEEEEEDCLSGPLCVVLLYELQSCVVFYHFNL